jgi:hypothetical protein
MGDSKGDVFDDLAGFSKLWVCYLFTNSGFSWLEMAGRRLKWWHLDNTSKDLLLHSVMTK